MLKHNLEPDLNAARRHLKILTGENDPAVSWQVFCDFDKERRDLARSYFGRLDEVLPKLKAAQQQGCGVYAAVNLTDGRGRRTENIIAGRAMFLDLDGSPLPAAWPVEPAIIVQSSNGAAPKYQAWWPVHELFEFEDWVAMQKRLADRYGGDPKCSLLTQVGRVAGFWHQKDRANPWRVEVVSDSWGFGDWAVGWSLRELAEKFEFDLDTALASSSSGLDGKVDKPASGWDHDVDVARARTFLADPSNWTPTSNGEVSIFKIACCLRDLAISPELAEQLIAKYSPIGIPREWSDDHIERKVRNAYKSAQSDAGSRSVADLAGEFPDAEYDANTPREVSGLSYLRADEIQEKPLNPLWPGRIYVGKLTTAAGIPDQGKSVVTCDMAARVSQGWPWPDGRGEAPVGEVIILSAEDDPQDTIKPRLMAAGADLTRVFVLNSLVRDASRGKGKKRMLNIADDLPKLNKMVQHHPNVRLLIIDPANAYMGTSKEHDSFRDSDVRAVLGPVKEWAEEHQIAVLIVTHFKKGGSGRAIDQVMGSLAFTALSRSAWAFIEEKGEDGEPTGRKLMAKIKQNIAEPVDALAYKLVGVDLGGGITAPKVAWGGEVKGNADDLMAGMKGKGAPKLAAAAIFLIRALTDGPVSAAVILERGKEEGFSEKTLNRAKVEAEAESVRMDGGWYWRLIEPETTTGD